MPTQNPQPQAAAPSPFEIVTPSKSNKGGKKGLLVAILVVVFLLLSIVAGVLLVRQNQNVAEKASGNCDSPSTIIQCPRSDGALVSCTPPDLNNNAQISVCNRVGRIESCGGKDYCCPAVGGTWTTNMTACTVVATATPAPTATPSPTATPVPSATPAGSATPTATPVPTLRSGTATPTAQKTSMPIPVTGTGWPTYVGAGIGVVVIIASILIAL